MPVETAADRAALLGDFGVGVRITPGGGAPIDLVGIVDASTREISGAAQEFEFLEPSPQALLRTEELAGLRVEDPVDVLEGPAAGLYIARAIVAEDDGEFSRIDLAEA